MYCSFISLPIIFFIFAGFFTPRERKKAASASALWLEDSEGVNPPCLFWQLEGAPGAVHDHHWLVGGFNHLEKYESQWEELSHRLWKITNVPNHQPVDIYT